MSRANIKAIMRKLDLQAAQRRAQSEASQEERNQSQTHDRTPGRQADNRTQPQSDTRPGHRNHAHADTRPGHRNHAHADSRSHTNNRVLTRDHSPTFIKGRFIHQEFSHGRQKRVLVVTKKQSVGPTIYFSKWLPADTRGVVAAVKVDGKVVFPDSRGVEPKVDGRNWPFYIIGKNRKGTVRFAQILVNPPKVEISASGMIVCTNRRPALIEASTKPTKPLPKNRQGRVADVFACDRSDDFYNYDLDLEDDERCVHCGSSDGLCDCHDHCDCADDDVGTLICQRIEDIERTFRNRPVTCPSCHSADCICDGTPNDGIPLRTTLNVLS